ncbi:hypothetical protein PTKIN_Ptkin14bG0200500 [Pterospermum kingtungense]
MIQVPETKEKWVCSVSNSWLFIADTKFPYRMELLNVLSGTQIDLPPIEQATYDTPFGALLCKLLLSKCPLNSDCTLFLLRHSYRRRCTISSLKPGQKIWSNLKAEFNEIHDAILYEEKLYATVIDSTTHRRLLVTCNYQLEVEATFSIPETKKFSGGSYYLVKSHNTGCLLLVEVNRSDKSFNIFSILEFDPCTKQFREVNDFDGFAFFLSLGGHLFAKAGNSETWFEANSIHVFSDLEIAFSVHDLEIRNFQYLPFQSFSLDKNNNGTFWFNLNV